MPGITDKAMLRADQLGEPPLLPPVAAEYCSFRSGQAREAPDLAAAVACLTVPPRDLTLGAHTQDVWSYTSRLQGGVCTESFRILTDRRFVSSPPFAY